MEIKVRSYMTQGAYSISRRQPLAAAHRLMRDHRIRHLPVVDGTRLVGVVSERDLHLIETLRDVQPETVLVEEAMTAEPFIVTPDSALLEVVTAMWQRRLGSAVVLDGPQIVGMFTTTDALRALADLLKQGAPRHFRPATAKPAARSAARR